ncbi:MAG: hypothetical protein ACKVQB_12770 [Bacteroidia bacterium]
MTIREYILKQFDTKSEVSIKSLMANYNGSISKQRLHKVIAELLVAGTIDRIGLPPKTLYRLSNKTDKNIEKHETLIVNEDAGSEIDEELLDSKFLVINEYGKILSGLDAFSYWCRQRNLPIEKTFNEYQYTLKKYEQYYTNAGIIDGIDKLKNTGGIGTVWLDKLFYIDFYAIERFGKTRLGTLLHYAKQGQNKFLMQLMMDLIRNKIEILMKENKIDCIAFVPPTIKREVQIMKFIEDKLNSDLPKLKIIKITGMIPIPQKSLSKLQERINNANHSFSVQSSVNYKNLLLIDDAVGSGTTMNEIAGKIKWLNPNITINGLAVVGSFKGFDVITDI